MASKAITLPSDVCEMAKSRAADAGFASVSEYLCALIRADAGIPLDEETEARLLKALETPAIEMTDERWEQLTTHQ